MIKLREKIGLGMLLIPIGTATVYALGKMIIYGGSDALLVIGIITYLFIAGYLLRN
jgi:hypothetical protein